MNLHRIGCFGIPLALALALNLGACGDDGGAEGTGSSATESGSGDGDSGDGDGDSGDGDGDSGDGDGDGDSGDGDGDSGSPCAWQWEATQMKANGQTHAAYDVAVAANGNFAAVGQIENASNDAWVALFSPDGETLWEAVVDSGSGTDSAVGATFDEAGDVVLVGRLASPTHAELWIEKRSAAAGAVVWTVREASEFDGDNLPGDIELAPDGSIVVSGTIRVGDQDSDIWVAKLDSADGSAIWTSSFSGTADATGFSIDRGGPIGVAADGSIYVGGDEGVDFETKEGVLLKYAPDGGEAQYRIAPKATGTAHIHDVVGVTGGPEGEAYFVIYQSGQSPGFWLSRASATGEIEWELSDVDFVYPPTSDLQVGGLDIADDGTLTIGGRLTNQEIGQGISWSEAWIANVSLNGVGECIAAHTWKNTHIIPARTFGYGLAEGPNGAIVVGEVLDGPENYLWVGGFR